MMSHRKKLSEFALIDALAKIVPSSKKVIKGIGDDTAVLPLKGNRYQLLTTDMLAQGVHFKKGTDPQLIGRKALACNISDIVAMGGVPTHAVISIAVPESFSTDFIQNVYHGIARLAREFDVSIVGGDTIAARDFMINISLMGEVDKKHLILRSGAKSQDWIWVTGALGRAWKTDHHLTFAPRVRQSQFLVRNFKPSAMMDISDGLAGDLGHILKQSHVGARLAADQIPMNKGALLHEALYDGEDFELLFTLSPAKSQALVQWQQHKRRWFFYPIGQITPERGLKLADSHGKSTDLIVKGYTHF